MAKIIITGLDGGLAPYWNRSINLTRAGGDNQYARGIVDGFTNPNVIRPSSADFTAVANASTVLSYSASSTDMVMADDYPNAFSGVANLYWGQGAKLHRFNTNTEALINDASFPRTVNPGAGAHSAHTSEVIDDVALYQLNGSPTLFYFFRDNTDGDAGSYNLNATFSANETVFSGATGGAVLNKDYKIIAEVADNNFMYVANGNAIHKFDGTTAGGASGTVTQTVIDINGTEAIQDIKDWRGKMLILSQETDSSGFASGLRKIKLYIWNRSSTSLNFDDVINVSGVTGAISRIFLLNDVPCIIAADSVVSGTTSYILKAFDGKDFVTVREIMSSNVDIMNLDSFHAPVVVSHNGFYFFTQDGDVYYLIDPLTQNSKLFHVGSIGFTQTTGWNVIAGISRVATNNKLLIPYYTNSATSLVYFEQNRDGSLAVGAPYTRVYDLPKLSSIKGITVFYEPLTSTADKDLTITAYKNSSSTAVSGTSLTINYLIDGARGYKYFQLGGEKWANTSAIQLKLTWPSGETITNSIKITRIEIEYSPTEKKI